VGQSIDGAVDQSHTIRTALSDYFEGERSVAGDLKDVLSRPALGPDGIQKLTVSALLGSLMADSSGAKKKKLGQLLDRAKELGLDDLTA
jgi:hypothetical protein